MSSSLYGQQGQQSQQQRQQQQSYGGYLNNVTQQQQQQQQHHSSSNQQSWYGFPVGASSTSSGYNSGVTAPGGNNAYSAASATSHGHPSSQHHRSMNLQGHTYSSLKNTQSLYDPYKSNPTG
jgi:type II secretory pathway pseudopilin PulG